MTPRITYYKRYRMELDLGRRPPPAALPDGFHWRPWDEAVIDVHADVLHRSFRDDLDGQVFPNLAHPLGAQELMRAIRFQSGFLPGATWLVVGADGAVGSVQGLTDAARHGALQNLGVVPGLRGLGLGEALLLKCLHGFRAAGLRRAYLEVTATNDPALRIYRRHGFRSTRTFYKPVEVPEPVSLGVGI